MHENIEKEIVRLVKEIAKDEKDLTDAERWDLPDKIQRYTLSMNRKIELLKILTKDKA
jgi:hypothetical protein